MLYLNTNNNLPSLADREEDKFNTLVQALSHSSTDSAIHIRKWAADWADSTVQRLVNRFPDLVDLFAKLHKIAAFRIVTMKPADLQDIKQVGWGVSFFSINTDLKLTTTTVLCALH